MVYAVETLWDCFSCTVEIAILVKWALCDEMAFWYLPRLASNNEQPLLDFCLRNSWLYFY